MKSFKMLLKDKLTELGYKVEIRNRESQKGYRGLTLYTRKQEGIAIERELINKYRYSRQAKIEMVYIYTKDRLNGTQYITKQEMEKIVEEVKANYHAKLFNPQVEETDVYVY